MRAVGRLSDQHEMGVSDQIQQLADDQAPLVRGARSRPDDVHGRPPAIGRRARRRGGRRSEEVQNFLVGGLLEVPVRLAHGEEG